MSKKTQVIAAVLLGAFTVSASAADSTFTAEKAFTQASTTHFWPLPPPPTDDDDSGDKRPGDVRW